MGDDRLDKPLAILLPLAFLLMLAQQANAGLYVGYANSDFYFEVNYGGAYTYMRTPYTYAYNDYYYFDYPFRVYSTGAYNYYQPGWYAFDPYWSFAPPATLNYTYYPPSYYYYNSAWTYYPDWIHTYGPAYYGSYYLPPSQPTLVGQSYQPQKEAGCNEASIVSYTINLQPGEKRHATFRLDNNSRKFLDIENVSVSPNGFGIRISNVKFEKVVSNNSSGNIEFDVFADEDAPRGMQGATIEVAATFRDGTFCPSPSISEDFTVDVAAPQRPKLQGSKPAPEAPTAKGSTSYLRPKDDSFAHFDEIKNTNTQSQEQSVTIIVNQDNAGQDDTSVRQCSDLSMSGSGITVVSGQSATNYIQFRNFAAEDFIIDAVEPVSHSSAFTIEAGRDFRKVFAGQVAAIKAGFFAPETGTDKLRELLNKKISNDENISMSKVVFDEGWDLIKLYFMVGLPTENFEDVEEIANLVKEIKNYCKTGNRRIRINIGVSSFVPKSHTPFQSHSMDSLDNLNKKINFLIGRFNKDIKWHNPKQSFIEAVFSRGDRKLAKVLVKAYKLGCKFDAWNEFFDFGLWQKAFSESGVDPLFYISRERKSDEIFP
ncbi:MAG TPA: hypothetical protein HA254_07085, partial [Candidatus Diapherotrites archaeon]|nr:hypothetical protein [Candidatus Diapherotrites archaeon]